jgi:hypothetical protein
MLTRKALYVGVLLIAAALLAIPQHADAQSRVALVIGNGTYQKVPALPNPLHDAQDVSDALKRLGFAVNTVTDADFDTFRRSLLEFGRRALQADIAIFYYAGHGVEINGGNWLLPIDAALKHEIDASAEAIRRHEWQGRKHEIFAQRGTSRQSPRGESQRGRWRPSRQIMESIR